MTRPRGPRPAPMSITAFVLRREALEVSLMLRVEAGYTARPGWRTRRACAGKPPEWWYNGHDKGKALCRVCPVRMDCVAATCAAENDVELIQVLGYTGVPSRLRLGWQKRRRAALAAP